MTIITTQSRVTYAGDNVSTLFSIPFEFFLNSDITAIKTAVGGAQTTLTQGIDYSLAGAGVVGGGSATKTTPLLTGEVLALFLNPPITQASHYISNSPFPSGTLENDIDRQAQISQRLQDQINRSIRAPDGDTSPVMILPGTAARALTYMAFDVLGNATAVPALPGSNMSQAIFNSFLAGVSYTGASADIANAAIVRNAGYSGGTFGFVNSALRVTDNVTGSGATAFEWAFTSILNNFATAGQNVAGYHQGNKNGNIGPTWASVSEVRETLAVNNPATGTVGHEIDVRANGTDSNNARIGSDVVITKFAAGAACQAGYAYRVQNAGDGVSNVGFGYGFMPGMIAAIGFDTSNGTMTSGAYQLAQNQAIIFDGPSPQTHKLLYDGVGLTYSIAGVLGARLLPNGVQVGTGKVLGASIGGYGTPTGGSRATLVPGTATLAQVCALVNQVIVDWQTHGALGA